METIGKLLSRDLSRKIEEIIQVDQADEPVSYTHLDVYKRQIYVHLYILL